MADELASEQKELDQCFTQMVARLMRIGALLPTQEALADLTITLGDIADHFEAQVPGNSLPPPIEEPAEAAPPPAVAEVA